MNQSQQMIADLTIAEGGPLRIIRITKNTGAKIQRKFRGIINILKKKNGLTTQEAVQAIINILASGVDPDKLPILFQQDIDRFFKGQPFYDPVTDIF